MEKLFANCNGDRVYVKPHIPHKKANNAIEAYAYGVSYDDIIVLFDESMLGSGKSGVVITQYAIFFKEDLEDSFWIKIHEIQDIEYKKSLLSKAVLINGKKVYSPTMADSKVTELIFSTLASNLEQIKNLSHTAIASEEASLTEENEQAIPTGKLLRVWGSDDLMQGIKARSHVDTAASVVGFALSFITNTNLMGENTQSEEIRKEIANAIYKIVNNIRTRNIDNRALVELKNNPTTFEIIVFACTSLAIEFSRRGANEAMIEYLIGEGLREFLGESLYQNMGTLITDRIFEADNLLKAQSIFYLKALMNNLAQALVDAEDGMEYIWQPNVIATLLPNGEALPDDTDECMNVVLTGACNFMADKMGQLYVGQEARDCADRLMDM